MTTGVGRTSGVDHLIERGPRTVHDPLDRVREQDLPRQHDREEDRHRDARSFDERQRGHDREQDAHRERGAQRRHGSQERPDALRQVGSPPGEASSSAVGVCIDATVTHSRPTTSAHTATTPIHVRPRAHVYRSRTMAKPQAVETNSAAWVDRSFRERHPVTMAAGIAVAGIVIMGAVMIGLGLSLDRRTPERTARPLGRGHQRLVPRRTHRHPQPHRARRLDVRHDGVGDRGRHGVRGGLRVHAAVPRRRVPGGGARGGGVGLPVDDAHRRARPSHRPPPGTVTADVELPVRPHRRGDRALRGPRDRAHAAHPAALAAGLPVDRGDRDPRVRLALSGLRGHAPRDRRGRQHRAGRRRAWRPPLSPSRPRVTADRREATHDEGRGRSRTRARPWAAGSSSSGDGSPTKAWTIRVVRGAEEQARPCEGGRGAGVGRRARGGLGRRRHGAAVHRRARRSRRRPGGDPRGHGQPVGHEHGHPAGHRGGGQRSRSMASRSRWTWAPSTGSGSRSWREPGSMPS